MKKPDLTRIDLNDYKHGDDFIVVSKIVMHSNFTTSPYSEGMDDVMHVVETPFHEDVVKHVYQIDNHDINYNLAIRLGLGIIRDVASGDEYLYNVDVEEYDGIQQHEIVKMGMYYQITHPEYQDTKLDIILNRTKGGEKYIRTLLNNPSDDSIIEKLNDIFKSHKGNGENVIEFKKKGV